MEDIVKLNVDVYKSIKQLTFPKDVTLPTIKQYLMDTHFKGWATDIGLLRTGDDIIVHTVVMA